MRNAALKVFFVVAGLTFAAFSAMIALTWLAGGLHHLSDAEWTFRVFGVIALSIFLGLVFAWRFRASSDRAES